MNTKWYIEFYIHCFSNRYWGEVKELLYYTNNIYYVLGGNMSSTFLKELITNEQYDFIISYILKEGISSFKGVFEIPEDKLFLIKLMHSDLLDRYLSNNSICEGRKEEGVWKW